MTVHPDQTLAVRLFVDAPIEAGAERSRGIVLIAVNAATGERLEVSDHFFSP